MKAILALEDGSVFHGESFGVSGDIVGEVVFNTGMTGYQEILTDASYYGQIVNMTYPLIGNYGINLDDLESANPQVRGFIVRELCHNPSNWRSMETLNEYLKKHNIIGIEGIDTRALTKILRDNGTMRGVISTNTDFSFDGSKTRIMDYKIIDAVKNVTTNEIKKFPGKGFKVVLMDFGMKRNIVRSLLNRDCEVHQVPGYTSAEEILAMNPDGIMLSNGPGDPKECVEIIQTIKDLYGKLPIFGICLGHQILALANGADTTRLKYGHRGCNHPVKDISKDITYITSQNHGYTIINETVDKTRMEVSHINMNDNTIEGIIYKDAPVFSVQFHPEASPGPKDTAYLFDNFMNMMQSFKASKGGI
jgi:carbamoyl-phosphate synthase small subunit